MAYIITKDEYFQNTQPAKSEELINIVNVSSNPLGEEDFEDELYKTSDPIPIENGEEIIVEIKFKDVPVRNPIAQGYYVSDITTVPPEADELEYNDITGLISSPKLATITDYYAWGATVTVTNDYGADGYCIIVVSGYPLKAEKEIVSSRDDDSIAENGILDYEFPDNHLVQSRNVANSIAYTLVESYSTPRKDININWRGNPALLLLDKVQIPEYQKGSINTQGIFSIFRQTLDFDGTLIGNLDGRKGIDSFQDTDDADLVWQDTDDADLMIQCN